MSQSNIININNGNNLLLEEKLKAIEKAANIVILENKELEKYILELKKELIKEKEKYNEFVVVVNNYKEEINIANANNLKKELKKNNLKCIDLENKLSKTISMLENSKYDANLLIKKLLAENEEKETMILEKEELDKNILKLQKELIMEKINHKTTANIAAKAAAAAKKAASAAATAAAAAAMK